MTITILAKKEVAYKQSQEQEMLLQLKLKTTKMAAIQPPLYPPNLERWRSHVQVRIPQCKIVNDDGKMGQPWGIAFGKDGVWAVVDCSNHCVCIFDSQDKLNKKFESSGKGNGQLSYPCGLAFDANNYLYVVDIGNHRVQKFDINGGYLLQFGSTGSGDGQLSNPVGITVYNDRVFVADRSNNRISVFQCDGQFSNTFGSGHLSSPYDVAVTNNNQVLVAGYGHHCISIFTLDGNYVNKIGTLGSDRGQLVLLLIYMALYL
ncbi:E3 ubiquitin-protein ligase TRIM71-like [Dysidea avara]|uniref:E3 ubiquitin-protein ligase TRIM71-like n=1 Tax=Dysidea avara TaxID=196820 RepID=UPI00331C356C